MSTRFVFAAVCAALAFGAAVPGAGARAGVSSSYAVSGVEASIPTNNTSTFAGAARGSGGDTAFWRSSVEHQALSSCPFGSGGSCTITGGTFTLAMVDGSKLAGTFAKGTVTPIAQTTPCGKETFGISGTLATTSGAATLTATLTHYRLSLFGTCITYFATIKGSLALA